MKLRQFGSYVAYRGLGEGLARVPEGIGNVGSAIVSEGLHLFKSNDRYYAERHLGRVLASTSPVVEPDPVLVRRWARRTFRAYGHYWAEGARLPHKPMSEIRARMRIESGIEHLAAGMATGNGVVMAIPHVGSWEWGGAFLASEGFPMTSVAEKVEPQELYDWFLQAREALGLRIIPLDEEASGVLLRTLRGGGFVGLVCDRDLGGTGVEVELFGEKTTLPAGPATLALRTGATLLGAVVYTGPRGYHTGVISPPFPVERTGRLREDVVRVTQMIANQFEDWVRRAPEQWYVFQPNWPSDAVSRSSRGVAPSSVPGQR